MRHLIIVLVILSIFSCSKNSAEIENHFATAMEMREADKLGESITELLQIIDKFPEHSRAAEAQFEIGKIYLNDVKDFDIAIEEFQKVIKGSADSEYASKALFMIGYIYANNVQAYSDAADTYNDFVNKYPEHELVPSVQYELEALAEKIEEIDQLNKADN